MQKGKDKKQATSTIILNQKVPIMELNPPFIKKGGLTFNK